MKRFIKMLIPVAVISIGLSYGRLTVLADEGTEVQHSTRFSILNKWKSDKQNEIDSIVEDNTLYMDNEIDQDQQHLIHRPKRQYQMDFSLSKLYWPKDLIMTEEALKDSIEGEVTLAKKRGVLSKETLPKEDYEIFWQQELPEQQGPVVFEIHYTGDKEVTNPIIEKTIEVIRIDDRNMYAFGYGERLQLLWDKPWLFSANAKEPTETEMKDHFNRFILYNVRTGKTIKRLDKNDYQVALKEDWKTGNGITVDQPFVFTYINEEHLEVIERLGTNREFIKNIQTIFKFSLKEPGLPEEDDYKPQPVEQDPEVPNTKPTRPNVSLPSLSNNNLGSLRPQSTLATNSSRVPQNSTRFTRTSTAPVAQKRLSNPLPQLSEYKTSIIAWVLGFVLITSSIILYKKTYKKL